MGFRQMSEPAGFEVDVVPVDVELQRETSFDVFMLQNDYAGAFVLGFSLGEPWMKDFQATRARPAVLYDNHIIGNPAAQPTWGSTTTRACTLRWGT